MSGPRVAVAVAALALAGCAAPVSADRTERSVGGVIVESGRLGTRHLRAGDCIRDPLPVSVEALFGVPCARPHAAQVLAVVETTEACLAALDVGVAALDGRDDLPEVDLNALVTDDGERVVCVLEFAQPISEDLVRLAS